VEIGKTSPEWMSVAANSGGFKAFRRNLLCRLHLPEFMIADSAVKLITAKAAKIETIVQEVVVIAYPACNFMIELNPKASILLAKS